MPIRPPWLRRTPTQGDNCGDGFFAPVEPPWSLGTFHDPPNRTEIDRQPTLSPLPQRPTIVYHDERARQRKLIGFSASLEGARQRNVSRVSEMGQIIPSGRPNRIKIAVDGVDSDSRPPRPGGQTKSAPERRPMRIPRRLDWPPARRRTAR